MVSQSSSEEVEEEVVHTFHPFLYTAAERPCCHWDGETQVLAGVIAGMTLSTVRWYRGLLCVRKNSVKDSVKHVA